MICADCLRKFVAIDGPGCLRCGRPLADSSAECSACGTNDFNLHQVRACFVYSKPLKTVIQRYKFDGLFALAGPLADLMAEKWPDWNHPFNLIVPIPLHSRRMRSRGFNQAELLARRLGRLVDVEVCDSVLNRVRHTRPQTELNPSQRKANVEEAFSAEPNILKERSVLLIDDVLTTGATMTSAADALLQAGAKNVSAYCLARAL